MADPRNPLPSEHLDADLIQKTLAGDERAFGHLMRRHEPMLLSSARRILGQSQEAEDVIQQVFIEAYRHLKEFRGDSRFSTWLYSIALNRCRNQLRSRKRRHAISMDHPMGESPEDHGPGLQIAERGLSHDAKLERRMEIDWMRKKISQLSVEYQRIFELHYFSELPLQEIAERLHRPLNTVKVYLHRARKEILEIWEKENSIG